MRVLDLFSGIGGFSLGLERAGMRTVAFCEIEPFCRRVLAKHWPGIPIYEDVRTLTAERLHADGIVPDVICGGFPCQDISVAGKGAGIEGERSGLWSQYARIIGEVRPHYIIVENVAALLGRGLDKVLGDLAEVGFDAEWHCIPASAVGAPHRRDRLWIVAHAAELQRNGCEYYTECNSESGWPFPKLGDHRGNAAMADTIGVGLEGCPLFGGYIAEELATIKRSCSGPAVADTDGEGCAQPLGTGSPLPGRGPRQSAGPHGRGWDHWLSEPDVGRVAHGVPARVDRLRSLGNAVVPQIPEIIGRAIMRASP